MKNDSIVRDARFLTKKNKARFNRKHRRAWNNGGKLRTGDGKGGYRKNGEDMMLKTMA